MDGYVHAVYIKMRRTAMQSHIYITSWSIAFIIAIKSVSISGLSDMWFMSAVEVMHHKVRMRPTVEHQTDGRGRRGHETTRESCFETCIIAKSGQMRPRSKPDGAPHHWLIARAAFLFFVRCVNTPSIVVNNSGDHLIAHAHLQHRLRRYTREIFWADTSDI